VLNVEQALTHPHTLHRQMVVRMGGHGLGAPVKLSRTPATYRHAPLSEGRDFGPDEGPDLGTC
jgi:crotonobetainyl-CoA:carnitine CoA-transferase CaiB-like acyl-CoA transferase